MAIRDVVINLAVGGLKDVRGGLKSVEQGLVALETIKARKARDSANAVDRAARDEVKATEKAVAAKSKLVEREAQDKIKSIQRVDAMAARIGEQAVKTFERQEEQKRRALDREESRKLASIQRSVKKEEELRDSASRRARSNFANSVGSRASYGITRGLHAGMGLATMALGAMGGFGIVESVRERSNMHGLASAIAIQGSKSKGDQFTSGEVLKTATQEGIRTGRGTEETLHGLQKFIDITGDLKAAQENIKLIGDYADASGSTLENMATAAAQLFSSHTVKNAEELGAALGVFTEMGKGGAIELKDFAKNFGKLTSTAGFFGGDKTKNAFTLGAIGELSFQHGGSASPVMAMTAVQRYGSDLLSHHKQIKERLGVDIQDKHGKMRNIQDITVDIAAATGGNQLKLDKLFGQIGMRGINAPVETFRHAIEGGATPKQATEAVIKELTELSSKMLSTQAAADQAASRRAESDRQFEIVSERLKIAMGEQLLPEFIKMIPQIERLIPALVSLVQSGTNLAEWFASNPFSGIGALVGAFLVKELAIAFAGAAIKTGVSTAITAPGAAAVGAGGLLGPAAVIAAGTYGFLKTAGATWNVAHSVDEGVGNDIDVSNALAKKLRTGKATPDDILASKDKIQQMKDKLEGAGKENTSYLSRYGNATAAILEAGTGGVLTGTARRDAQNRGTEAQSIKDAAPALQASIEILTRAIEKAGSGANGLGVHGPAPSRDSGMADTGGIGGAKK